MSNSSQECANGSNIDKSDDGICNGFDGNSMGKEERKRRVLKLLVESGLALPPSVIFYNVKERGADFERRSIDNYLTELVEDGYVEKVNEEKGYYAATRPGVDYYMNQ